MYYLYEISSIYLDDKGKTAFCFWVIVDKIIPACPDILWHKENDKVWRKWLARYDERTAWLKLIEDKRAIKVLKETLTEEDLWLELL